jgi:AmmeMemoRadiSam system protein A
MVEKTMSDQISPVYGRRLLKLVRETIAQRLGLGESIDRSGLDAAELKQELATFVTLTIGGRLRGCIGNLEPNGPLLESLMTNARQAAFHDHRFSPLSREEFEQLHIHISILTRPERLDYLDGDDLLRKLRPNIDGVIIKKGAARATFLPQVWEQLPRPQQFLEHLCLKAGLHRSAWQALELDVYRYLVQSFEEETNGADS